MGCWAAGSDHECGPLSVWRAADLSKKSEYEDVEAGKWTACNKTIDLACCDCGLVHRIKWRIRKSGGRDELQLRFTRNGPATGGVRKALRAARKRG